MRAFGEKSGVEKVKKGPDLEDIGWPEKGVRVSVLLDGTQLVQNPWSKRLRWSLPGS